MFQKVKEFLIAISLILFAYVSRQYCYHVRDEVVNEQFLVEEIYKIELLTAVQLEEEEALLATSCTVYATNYLVQENNS